ncbi:MAG: WbqC family protein [Bacteroidia bacterium]|nr:WbqC family protein [Bacteroidia bacterium]MDW8302560.1 WbqC family protein [Bacteroidia bacterium]
MKVAILQSNYIPWKGYFDIINDVDIFVFYDCVKYTKNDWRNRNRIYSKNGVQWLTIPISSCATNLMIDEVKITDSRWQEKHYKSLSLAYRNAPYYYQLEELMSIYLIERKWDYLSELNQYLIKYIANKIGVSTKFYNARELNISHSHKVDKVERLIDILSLLKAKIYISGPAAKEYILGKEYLFYNAGIELFYKHYPKYPPYKQLSSPFEDHVSIVDMIANIAWHEIPKFIWQYER